MKWIMAMLALFVCASTSLSAIFTVSPVESIQTAVNSADYGDTVLIQDGSYAETVILYGATLTIGSGFLLDQDTTHVANTVIYPNDAHADTNSCFVYAYGEEQSGRLIGLTLTGGTGTYWNFADAFAGGVLYIHQSSLSVEHCVIVSSTADVGGGAAAANDFAQPASFVLFASCSFRNCYSNWWGGGLYVRLADFRALNCNFVDNVSVAPLDGGGAFVIGTLSEFNSCLFARNAGITGGLALGGGQALISNCTFLDDSVNYNVGYTDVSIFDCRALITHCAFENGDGRFGSIYLQELVSNARIDFVGNVVRGFQGTVISATVILNSYSDGDFAYNVIRDNVNLHGGAVFLMGPGSTPRIHHNYFTNNSALDGTSGSAVKTVPWGQPSLDSNWFEGNSGIAITTFEDDVFQPLPIQAENNWWGSASGPFHPLYNPSGQGDTVLHDSITVLPWLTSPPDTTMPNAVDDRPRPNIPRTWQLMDVYPNPFNASVWIVLAGFTNNDFAITLHNLLGQQVDVVNVGAMTGGQISYTALPTLSSGVYFLKASDRDVIQTKKVVLMK